MLRKNTYQSGPKYKERTSGKPSKVSVYLSIFTVLLVHVLRGRRGIQPVKGEASETVRPLYTLNSRVLTQREINVETRTAAVRVPCDTTRAQTADRENKNPK